jgi:hypothetical protein
MLLLIMTVLEHVFMYFGQALQSVGIKSYIIVLNNLLWLLVLGFQLNMFSLVRLGLSDFRVICDMVIMCDN